MFLNEGLESGCFHGHFELAGRQQGNDEEARFSGLPGCLPRRWRQVCRGHDSRRALRGARRIRDGALDGASSAHLGKRASGGDQERKTIGNVAHA